MSEVVIDPAPKSTDINETSTIRDMRTALEAKNTEIKEAYEAKKAAEAKLTEIERKDMAETERLKAELADAKKVIGELEPIRDEHGKFVASLESLYNKELENIPEDKRLQVAALSARGSWADRLEQLQAAKALIPTSTSAGTKTAAGAVVPGQTEVSTPTPRTGKEIAEMSWGEAFKAPPSKTAT
jgi:hypothetical protein